jgi:hypothetical protein
MGLGEKGRCAVMEAIVEAQVRRRRFLLAMSGLIVSAEFTTSAPASAGDDATKKKGGGLSYIQLEPLNAALTLINGRRQILSVECGLDVPDAALHARTVKSLLLLRDAYLRWVTVYAASLPPMGAPNPDLIGAELQRQTNNILGRPGARLVLGTVMVN